MDDGFRSQPTSSKASGGTTPLAEVVAQEVDALFTRLAESALHRESTPATSDLSSRVKILKVHPTPLLTEDNKLRYSPSKIRTMGQVDPALLDAFRMVASGRKAWPLFVTGKPGGGKTCAALALLDHTSSGIYMTVNELVGRRMQSFKTGAPEMPWVPLFSTQQRALVVLDELGTRQTVNDTHYECVQQVLDMREGYPLILISNLSLDQIEQRYDDRIASRCGAGTVVELKGRDRRID